LDSNRVVNLVAVGIACLCFGGAAGMEYTWPSKPRKVEPVCPKPLNEALASIHIHPDGKVICHYLKTGAVILKQREGMLAALEATR
jgi:hypothetical protein